VVLDVDQDKFTRFKIPLISLLVEKKRRKSNNFAHSQKSCSEIM
jgi:hypothetical protein